MSGQAAEEKAFLWQFLEDDSAGQWFHTKINPAKWRKEIFMAVMSLPEEYREVIFLIISTSLILTKLLK